MKYIESPTACPSCRAKRWWGEYYMPGTNLRVMRVAPVGELGFMYCLNCGFLRKYARDPVPPWDDDAEFPLPDLEYND